MGQLYFYYIPDEGVSEPEFKEASSNQLGVSVGQNMGIALQGVLRGSSTSSKGTDMMMSKPKIPRIICEDQPQLIIGNKTVNR